MLTGGIDLSVGFIASMAGFLTEMFVNQPGGWACSVSPFARAGWAALAGLVSGIGVGVFRVHPLIVTLGMGLVVLGFSNVWQLKMLQTGAGIPPELRYARQRTVGGTVPNQPPHLRAGGAPLRPVRRTVMAGVYAIGDNPIAARLSVSRSWQVLILLYVISAVLAAIAGLIYAGLSNTASVTLVAEQLLPSVAAAVIGGTSILGGRGSYTGTMLGAVILTVLGRAPHDPALPEPWRQIVFGSIVVFVAAAYTRATAES